MKIFTRMFLVVGILAIVVITSSCDLVDPGKKTETAQKELQKVAQNINADFVKIRQEVEKLAAFTATLYGEDSKQKVLKNVDTSKYRLASNGVFYKPEDDGKAAVFVSGFVPVDENIKTTVYFTEPLDSALKEIVSKYPEGVQAYYNDRFSYNRIYPFFDVLTQYEPKMNIPSFNFYYLADAKHNPEKKGVWVNEPYVDPAGRGWMVSAIAPVYVNGALEGVPGIDVTISAIMDRYLSSKSQNIMIIDANGVVVATQEYLASLFSLPPLLEHKYLETIKSDTYQVDRYNLLKNKSKDVREMALALIKGQQKKALFSNRKDRFTVLAESIPELHWTILEVIQ